VLRGGERVLFLQGMRRFELIYGRELEIYKQEMGVREDFNSSMLGSSNRQSRKLGSFTRKKPTPQFN
jgi:hypothetical protein